MPVLSRNAMPRVDGVRDLVIAWTLDKNVSGFSGQHKDSTVEAIPMECAGEHKEVVDRDLVQSGVEVAVVDQAPSFVDYNE